MTLIKLFVTGDVRLLQHKENKILRLLMRREKTLRVCANHFIRPWMILKPMKGSDRAYMWQVHADFAGIVMVIVLTLLHCDMVSRE